MAQIHAGVVADEATSPIFGKMLHRGLVNCFAKGLKTEQGEMVYCETSAVVYDNTRIILASDKPVPGVGHSSVFFLNYEGSGPLRGSPAYLRTAPFLSAIKYEDMTLTPDGANVIATTGFDRVKSDTASWDGYNTMLMWPVGSPDAVSVVAPTTTDGVTSSVSLRKSISRHLSTADFPLGVPYFKVESVAVIPGQTLLLGIREGGADYENFNYTARIIAVPYAIEEGLLTLTGEMQLVYEFDPSHEPLIMQETGLSSIEYDRYHDRLYLLTSFETSESDEGLGGYLWVLPMEDLLTGKPPALVLKESGAPLLFAHKPEGVTVLGDNLVLVVHDDDRTLGRDSINNPETQFTRGPHQAAYSLVALGTADPDQLPPGFLPE